jgi:hypothetical protein
MERRPKPATTVALAEGSERLLHWLERYPFQRTQDLVLALAPWERRTSVYAHLAELERCHLIEALHAGVAGRKHLYHLSPLGQYVLDSLAVQGDPTNEEKQARWEHWEKKGIGPCVQEEREKLVRLLPRLPLFLLLQESINSLVTHAGLAFAHQGHQARMIGWSWLRDYEQTFAAPREQALRFHVEGALALCLHVSQAETDALPSHMVEQWYTVFVLHCPLDEVRLMRMRLDRLLRWRESAERVSIYSQMPPLLILATTERQAEWWHQATMQATSHLRVDLPLGAITCLPRAEKPFPNLWNAAFRRLGTKEWCHLPELFHSWTAPSVPELLALRGEATDRIHTRERGKKQERQLLLPARLRVRSYTLAGKPLRTPQTFLEGKHTHNAPLDYRLYSVFLVPRHWEILRLCFAHPFLSRADLAQLLVLSQTTTNLLLADLERMQYLAGVDTLTGERWQVAEAGLRLLARLASCHIHRLMRFPREEGKPLMQRGVPGLLHQIHHTAGVYTFFAQLSKALATYPDACVRWWETGVISERHFSFRDKTYRFRPDALATVQLGSRSFRFWLEWDRGTMTAKDLRLKFTTYAMYLASREWASSSPALPALLCVTPDIGQEKQLIKAALQRLVHVPTGLCVYTTTVQLLLTQGMLNPIWRPLDLVQPSAQRVVLETAPRLALFLDKQEK